MAISDKLRELRREKGLSQIQTADFLTRHGAEVTQRAVSKWERGDTQPNAEQFLLLCELYEVRDVLAVFRGQQKAPDTLNALGKSRVREYIRLLEADPEFSSAARERPQRIERVIPLYDLPVSAGSGQFLDSDSYELLEVDESVPLSATYAVRISGDSMTPRFVDRQIVYVKQQQTLRSGECGIFLLNGDAYCKQLRDEGELELVSLNSKYPPIKISEYDELRILGKVVG
jgi:phage repressor protein C with HTH and peptisase S24 domain